MATLKKYKHIGEYILNSFILGQKLDVDVVETESGVNDLQKLLSNQRKLTHRDDILLSVHFRLTPGHFKYMEHHIEGN